jgi:hypothetical protein
MVKGGARRLDAVAVEEGVEGRTHKGKDGEKIKDVKLTTYWGDIHIERADETLWFPNHKVVLMNGTIVYMAPNKTPYPPIIYRGYERTGRTRPVLHEPDHQAVADAEARLAAGEQVHGRRRALARAAHRL